MAELEENQPQTGREGGAEARLSWSVPFLAGGGGGIKAVKNAHVEKSWAPGETPVDLQV